MEQFQKRDYKVLYRLLHSVLRRHSYINLDARYTQLISSVKLAICDHVIFGVGHGVRCLLIPSYTVIYVLSVWGGDDQSLTSQILLRVYSPSLNKFECVVNMCQLHISKISVSVRSGLKFSL